MNENHVESTVDFDIKDEEKQNGCTRFRDEGGDKVSSVLGGVGGGRGFEEVCSGTGGIANE